MNKNIDIFTEDRVSALGLHRYATDYFESYKLISLTKNNYLGVRSYLLCHSLELSMKAVLRSYGLSVLELRKLKHNLERISKELENHPKSKIKWNRKQNAIIYVANLHYSTKEWEYFLKGSKTLVDFEIFSEFLDIWLARSYMIIEKLS